MRLTAKFLLLLILATAAVLGVSGWLRTRREVDLFEDDMRRDAAVIAVALARAVEHTWTSKGAPAAMALLSDFSRDRHINARLLGPGGQAALPASVSLRQLVERGASHQATSVRDDGRGFLFTYLMIGGPPGQSAVLELAESLADERRYIKRTVRDSLTSAAALLLAAGGAAMILGVAFIARPTQRLVEKARRIGAGDLGGPLRLRQRDELGEVARAIDRMCDQLDETRTKLASESTARMSAVDQLRHAERLTTVGKLASGLAHELGTPLNVIAGRAQMIEAGELAGQEATESARIIHEQSQRMTSIIRQLLDFARRGKPGASARTDLGAVVQRTAGMLGAMARKAGVDLELPGGEPVEAMVDEAQVQQVVSNLLVNAIHASTRGGRVTVAVASGEAVPPVDVGGPPRRMASIAVRDEGCGMPPEIAARVFEPFFTTKGVGEGTGLGLSVAHGIVHDNGGWITVDSALGRGSDFTVYLPRAEAA
ncbi:MAG TPA: HAMP domain-containing sensor histidine kinase [Kofleriaceae bacterium]|nr:HAMP domain-containing sensor histidine kinase [Kofleriaceae bacterium]